jgi:DNA-binding response OmpR family regulator
LTLKKTALKYALFNRGADLLGSFSQQRNDIVLLDIDMPEMTCMEIASRIRMLDKNVQIALLLQDKEAMGLTL